MYRDQLYCQVGEALHLGQVFEFNLRVLVSIANKNFGTSIDIDALIVKEDKKTLGVLLKELNKVTKLDQAGQEAYRDALKKRNYIAHDFFLKNTYAFSDKNIFQETMDRLKGDTKTIAIAAAISSGFLEGVCSALKIDKSDIVVEQSAKQIGKLAFGYFTQAFPLRRFSYYHRRYAL